MDLTAAADGKATLFKRNNSGISKANVVQKSGGKEQFLIVLEPTVCTDNSAKIVCAVAVRQQVLLMSFASKDFGIFCHHTVGRSKIRKIEINRLQQTEFLSNGIQGFSSSQKRHVAQEKKPLCRRECAVVLLAPF